MVRVTCFLYRSRKKNAILSLHDQYLAVAPDERQLLLPDPDDSVINPNDSLSVDIDMVLIAFAKHCMLLTVVSVTRTDTGERMRT